VSLGLVAGYYGGWVDELIMRLVDLWHALPFLLVALVVVVVSHRGDWQVSQQWIVMGLLALLAWSGFVRNIRAETLILKETEYVMFARVSGASKARLIYRHLLPGVFNTAIVIATFATGNLILAEASLSFLGAGIPSPTPAWGLMIAEARDYVASAWWTSFFPGLAIFLVVMSLNFTGDWLRDRLDPRLREL
jgi:peptide/nickel transport system permease protein